MDSARHGSDTAPPAGARELFDASSDAAAVVSAAGVVIGWTRAAEELLGHPAREVVGGSAARLLAMPEDPVRAAGVAERCRAGMGWSGHIPLRHRDGHRIDVDLRVSACFRIGAQECFLLSAREQRQEWTVGRSVLDGFLTRSPVGMAVMDLDLRYMWLNDTLERFGGVPRAQRIGRRLSELLPGLHAETLEGLMRKVLATGVPVTDYEYVGWSWADPHRQHAYSTSFFPLLDADNSVTGVGYMVLDVTERWNARQLLSLVNDAGTSIGRTLDVMRTAQELADFAVPRFADFVVVDLLETVLSTEGHGTWLTDAGPAAAKPLMRRAGMSSVREGCPEAVARVGDRVDFLPPPHNVNLLIDGEPILIPVLDPSDALWVAEQPERVVSIREFGLHSLISVPMRARNAALGLTTFIRSLNPVPFQPDDVLLARELVARAALCVDNARRYTREHTSAVTLQRSLLPQALTGGTALEVASYYLPADPSGGVGGDWFDVIPLSGSRVGLVVGDVVGHGITAAATMGRLRTAVQTLADMELPPADLLAHLDDLVLRLSEEKTDESTTPFLGATCLYAVYDPVTRRCTMARAGHPPPVVVAPDGQVSFPEPPAGPPLGLGGMAFESAEIELAENSLLGLYTDGLIAGADRDMELGMSKLGEALAQHSTGRGGAHTARGGGEAGAGEVGAGGGEAGRSVAGAGGGEAGRSVAGAGGGDARAGVAGDGGADAGRSVAGAGGGDAREGVAGAGGGDAREGVAGAGGGDAREGVAGAGGGDAREGVAGAGGGEAGAGVAGDGGADAGRSVTGSGGGGAGASAAGTGPAAGTGWGPDSDVAADTGRGQDSGLAAGGGRGQGSDLAAGGGRRGSGLAAGGGRGRDSDLAAGPGRGQDSGLAAGGGRGQGSDLAAGGGRRDSGLAAGGGRGRDSDLAAGGGRRDSGLAGVGGRGQDSGLAAGPGRGQGSDLAAGGGRRDSDLAAGPGRSQDSDLGARAGRGPAPDAAAHSRPAPDPDLAVLCAFAVERLVPVPQPDDIALLLTRTHALGADHVISWDVPADPAAVADVRARATRQVEAWGLEELAMTTELIVSELVTNAVRYAAPPIHLRLLRDSRLTCEVADGSSTAPRLRHARSTDEGGRGLFLVAQLAHRWGARYTPGGKIIWAEQEIP
ncbi:SpoIIE family protein phosphatase [Streptomyces spinoverrucosus]|uniref:SpoIIE family protein phosphatase n=1 Tax=Streptomyces spinoverrucosus TaxID=284043 RepID=UPI001E4FF7B1|nr:SpoIIE family protein phosphatase [Streptomyces spinoverrucosus]